MPNFKTVLAKSIYTLDKRIDQLSYRLSSEFADTALVVTPYLSYGNQKQWFVQGRVLEARAIKPSAKDSSFWDNFQNTYKRFASHEIPNAELELSIYGQKQQFITDEEGYFKGAIKLEFELEKVSTVFHEYSAELLSPIREEQELIHFSGSVLVPSSKAEFGVISDIDDTVLKTDATSIVSMAKKTLFGNAKTRLPFDGVADFYNVLHKEGQNPVFYVSSSPWNLYDVLLEFLDHNEIPAGPLLLRDWGTSPTEFLPTSHSTHKLEAISGILKAYPNLKFILIGDSGQQDPEIYVELVKRFPNRILMIYIRDVTEDVHRDQFVENLGKAVFDSKTNLLLVQSSYEAQKHAQSKGWL